MVEVPHRYSPDEIVRSFYEKIKINPDTGCWEWTGCIKPNGYAQFRHGYAHRWSVENLSHTRIPYGMTVDHLCRNTKCVNPDHLEVVTQAINTARGTAYEKASEYFSSLSQCCHGHPRTPDNIRVDSRGNRICRACGRERQQRYRNRLVAPSGDHVTPHTNQEDS